MNQKSDPVTIVQVEGAIDHWRERRSPADVDNPVLCAEARALADVYGLMIYNGQERIERSSLTARQLDALAAVL